jgi:hypothetical protein
MALTRRWWAAVAIAAITVAILGQQFGTHSTPEGQPALVHLNSTALETLRSDFNRASGDVRLILLLSPT